MADEENKNEESEAKLKDLEERVTKLENKEEKKPEEKKEEETPAE